MWIRQHSKRYSKPATRNNGVTITDATAVRAQMPRLTNVDIRFRRKHSTVFHVVILIYIQPWRWAFKFFQVTRKNLPWLKRLTSVLATDACRMKLRLIWVLRYHTDTVGKLLVVGHRLLLSLSSCLVSMLMIDVRAAWRRKQRVARVRVLSSYSVQFCSVSTHRASLRLYERTAFRVICIPL